MANSKSLTGIILAGGKSSRMGQDKALLNFQGKRLIEYAIDQLKPLCSELLISVNQPGYEQIGLELIPDQYKNCGPVGGLHAALSASKTNWNLVVSCDTPFLNQQLFKLLLENREGVQAVIPKRDKGLEPLAALYHRNMSVFFEQKLKAGDYKLHRILKEADVKFLDVLELIAQFPKLFLNLNSPGDL
ncbi:MAG TPA: molybdenum cofactor guanylyltransferase [Sunxiuqinia sp.]|nr:molybdenum cofactor guanylyltransferase [Sunxiuqinia sp.]